MKRAIISAFAATVFAATAMTESASAKIGEYESISCDPAYVSQFSCDQCFDGGTWAVGETKTDYFDTWTNTLSGSQIIYQNNQSLPSVHPLDTGTQFASNPEDPKKFWKFASDIVWTDSVTNVGDKEFELATGKQVTMYESELGAGYTLSSTNVKDGDPVAVLLFPLSYSTLLDSGTESDTKTHEECVIYKAKITNPAVPTPKPTPEKVTSPKTGPESVVMFMLALMAGAAILLVASRRKA
ncbi:MAG TPA: hypothetical protein PK765_00285 [bacterium]|nr:hypothetical protein [bacterium]